MTKTKRTRKTKTMRNLAWTAALLLILALLLAFDALNGDPLSQQWLYIGPFDMRKSYIRRKHFTGTSAPPLMDSSFTMWYTFSLTRAVIQTLRCRRGSGC